MNSKFEKVCYIFHFVEQNKTRTEQQKKKKPKHRKEIREMTFQVLASRQSESRRANARNVTSAIESLYGG